MLSLIYADKYNIRGDTFVSPRGRSRLELKHIKIKKNVKQTNHRDKEFGKEI